MLNEELIQLEKEDQLLKHLPLVEKVVNNLKIKSHEYERNDLINLGFIGLMDAIEKYIPNQKATFESYAYIRIRGAIIDEIRKTSKIPRSGMDKLKKYYRAKEELEIKFHRIPTEKEIMQKMNVNEKFLDDIYSIIHQLSSISLEKVVFNENGNGVELLDLIEDSETADLDQDLLNGEMKEYLIKAIQQLPEREQQILNLYYVDQLSLKEIAYIYEISVPRVSQIHGKIIIKLRDYIRRKYDDD